MEWSEWCRSLYAAVLFIKQSGRYTLFAPGNLGKGDFNVYRMFVETGLRILRPGGCIGQVVPEGLYNGANCMAIRKFLFERCELRMVFGFENTKGAWFEGIHKSAKFCIYAARNHGKTIEFLAAFNVRTTEGLAYAHSGRGLSLPVSLVEEFSPDALAIMEFQSQFEINVARRCTNAIPSSETKRPGRPVEPTCAKLTWAMIASVLRRFKRNACV